MKERRTHVWIATVLSALVLAGLLLIFGLGLFEDNKPGTVTPTPAVTLTDSVTPTDGAAPTESIPPTGSATLTPGGSDNSGAVNPRLDTSVYVLDVGEGSSALFCSGTTAVLIDGGDAATSSYVVGFLKSLGIRRLQLVVATHYDSDHISGLVGALSAFTVDRVWGPAYEGDTKTYNSFAAMIRKKEIPWELVNDGREFSADGCTVTVLASSVPVPVRMEGTQESDGEGETGEDTSLALRVTLDNVSILVMGDSGAARERALVKKGAVGKFDIFLVNHHGSRYSNSAELLAAARPEYAVISVGENDYGHPTKECIDRLRESGAKIYRTDLQGMITFTIEGGRILPGTLPLEDPYGTPEDSGQTRVEHPSDVSFILNGNSMVYHLPDCSSVAGVMRRNWFYFYGTAEEAEALGYRPCGSCLRH
jgi:Predicted hydrolase (metallo-beta-lactamase superfamily)